MTQLVLLLILPILTSKMFLPKVIFQLIVNRLYFVITGQPKLHIREVGNGLFSMFFIQKPINFECVLIKEPKRGIGSLFDPCVNAMGWWPYWQSRMEVSYCTFGFGMIIQRDWRTLSLLHDSPHDNLYARVIKVHAGRATHAKQNCLVGLATKKSGGTITHLHM